MRTKLLFIIPLFFLIICCSGEYNPNKLKKWGTTPFDKKLWAQGDPKTRGTMIYDFLKTNSPMVGKERLFILDQLGEPTSYDAQEEFPAYAVGPQPPDGIGSAYTISFITDGYKGKVTTVDVNPEP